MESETIQKNGAIKFLSIIVITVLFAVTPTDAFSQVKGKWRGGLDAIAGFTVPITDNVGLITGGDINVGYNLTKNMNLGFKVGGGWGFCRNLTIRYDYWNLNLAGTYTYYFGSRTNLVTPFVGGGLGFHMLTTDRFYYDYYYGSHWATIEGTTFLVPKFSGFITTGLEIGKFRLAIKYELIPASKYTSYYYNYDEEIYQPEIKKLRNSYFTVNFGFYLGGGSRKQAAAVLEQEKAEKREKIEKAAALEQEKIALERERIALEREKLALGQEEQRTENTVISTYDVILLKNGQEIKAKVIEITPSEIKYKASENFNEPTRTIQKNDVFVIIYANGTREVISADTKSKNSSAYNKAGEVSMGLGASIYAEKEVLMGGFSGKLRVGIAKPVRLEAAFTYNPPQKTELFGTDLKLSMWDVTLNIQPIVTKNNNFILYPLIGLRVTGFNMKMSELDVSENGKPILGLNLGAGFDVKLSKKVFFNVEPMYVPRFIKGETVHGFKASAGFIFKL